VCVLTAANGVEAAPNKKAMKAIDAVIVFNMTFSFFLSLVDSRPRDIAERHQPFASWQLVVD